MSGAQFEKIASQWKHVSSFFTASQNKQLQDEARTYQAASSSGAPSSSAVHGLQINVEPIASHADSTGQYLADIATQREEGVRLLNLLHVGGRKPTVDEVYAVIDSILGQTRTLRQEFEARCAKQPSAFQTRNAVALDMDGDHGEAHEDQDMEEVTT